MATDHDGKKQAGASGQPDGSGARNREPQPKSEVSPVRAKPPRGQNLKQNTRNQGYQQDR